MARLWQRKHMPGPERLRICRSSEWTIPSDAIRRNVLRLCAFWSSIGVYAGRLALSGSGLRERGPGVVARLGRYHVEFGGAHRVHPWPSVAAPGVEKGRLLGQV